MPDSAPNLMPPSMPDVAGKFAFPGGFFGGQRGAGRLLGSVLDELELLVGDLLRQQKELAQSAAQVEFQWRRTEIERQKADMEALREGILDAVRTETARASSGTDAIDQRLGELLNGSAEERQAVRTALSQLTLKWPSSPRPRPSWPSWAAS